MRGREAKLTFLLGFQCRILHKKHQFYCPMKNRHFLRKVGFRENSGFTGFLPLFLLDMIKLSLSMLSTYNLAMKTSF